MKHPLLALGLGFMSVAIPAQERRMESFLGNLAPVARSIQLERGFPLEDAFCLA